MRLQRRTAKNSKCDIYYIAAMTPEEFRDFYLEAQNDMGNHLQTLVDLSTQMRRLVELVTQDYQNMNKVVDEFLTQQPNSSSDQASEDS